MAYRLPRRSKKSGFTVVYGDDTYTLPAMQDLPMNFLVRIQSANVKMESRNKKLRPEGQAEMMTVFMDVLAKYAPPVAEDITSSQFEDLMEAWSAEAQDEEDESLGE